MNNPSELVVWAFAIGFAWLMLTGLTGIDEWLKKLVGRKGSTTALAAQIEALEKRVAQLEQKSASVASAK